MLTQPQEDAPVIHHFGPGIYIREVHLPANALVIGHHHKTPHLNILLSGAIALNDHGVLKVLEAPFIYTATPGRKIAYTLFNVVWQNLYSTTETDVEKLEEEFLCKSQASTQNEEEAFNLLYLLRQSDRDDYGNLVKELQPFGYTEELIT